MGRLAFISILFFVASITVGAQSLKRVAKLAEKPEFDKVKEQIDKILIKDAISFGATYFKTLYYLDNSLGQYDLDSARITINQALYFLEISSEDQLDDWEKTELPIQIIDSTKIRITELTFDREFAVLSDQSMKKFLELFPKSHLNDTAIFLRDSMAYEGTLEIDTWQAYKSYMDEYTDSKFLSRAKENYDILLFKDKTKSGSLESHVDFLRDFPNTPFRRAAEEVIFKKMVVGHEKEKYLSFIHQYPNSHLRKKSVDILYYLSKAGSNIDFSEVSALHPKQDSLFAIQQLEQAPLMPVLFEDGFSLMDTYGNTLEHLRFEELDASYQCGNVLSEWLRVKQNDLWQVVNRNGDVLLADVISIREISKELILLKTINESKLYHKAGFLLASFNIADVRVIYDRWLAFTNASHWGLMTFTGEVILQPQLDDLKQVGEFLIVEKGGRFEVLNQQQIPSLTESNKFDLKFDDFEILGDTILIGFDGDKESLIDRDLNILLPLEEQEIYPKESIWYVKQNGLHYLFDWEEKKLSDIGSTKLLVNESWLGQKLEDKWVIKNIIDKEPVFDIALDSVQFINHAFAYVEKQDSILLLTKNGKTHLLKKEQTFSLLEGSGNKTLSKSFILTTQKAKKTIINETGEEVFEGEMDEFKYLNDSLFIVKNKGKYGVYEIGKGFLQRATYDLISEEDGLAILLKNNQIGCIDLINATIIPAVYQSRIERFMSHYLVSRNNKKGVLDMNNKVIVPIEFEELKPWNDSTFWAKEEGFWSLRDYSGGIMMEEVSSLKKWGNYPDDQLHIIMQEEKYGIIDPEKGLLIPPMYNDIINIGTPENPIFFAEERLETANFYVVTYFNSSGETIKSQAYRTNEYELIYCDQ